MPLCTCRGIYAHAGSRYRCRPHGARNTCLHPHRRPNALAPTHPRAGAGAQSGQYEYEASYPCIDRRQRLFPRPLASLLRCCATVHRCSSAPRHPALSLRPLSPAHTERCINTCTQCRVQSGYISVALKKKKRRIIINYHQSVVTGLSADY